MDNITKSKYIPMQNQNVLYEIPTIPADIITYILFFDNYIIIKEKLIQIKQIDKKLPIYEFLFNKFNNSTIIYHPNSTVITIKNNKKRRFKIEIFPHRETVNYFYYW
jgi:hypothetical protein